MSIDDWRVGECDVMHRPTRTTYRKLATGVWSVSFQHHFETEHQARRYIVMGRPAGSKNKPKPSTLHKGGKINSPEVDDDDDDDYDARLDDDDDDDDDDDEPAPKPKPKAKAKPQIDDDDDDDDDDGEPELPKRNMKSSATAAGKAPAASGSGEPLTSKALQKALQAMLDSLKAG